MLLPPLVLMSWASSSTTGFPLCSHWSTCAPSALQERLTDEVAMATWSAGWLVMRNEPTIEGKMVKIYNTEQSSTVHDFASGDFQN